LVTHLANSLHEILFNHIVPLSANGKHTRFGTNVSKICSIEAISELANRFVINIAMLGDWSSMDLENFEPTLFSIEMS